MSDSESLFRTKSGTERLLPEDLPTVLAVPMFWHLEFNGPAHQGAGLLDICKMPEVDLSKCVVAGLVQSSYSA